MIAIKDWVKQVGLGAGIVAVLSLFSNRLFLWC